MFQVRYQIAISLVSASLLRRTGIPSLPISYKDALPLLKSLENHGDRVGEEWEGALPGIHYFTGPSEDILHMHNAVKESIKPIWCLFAECFR